MWGRLLKIATVLGGFVLLTAGACNKIVLDSSVSAAEGNDPTIILAGYGAKAQKGYLFVQLSEGSDTNGGVQLIVPKLDCARESCVRYQFFRKDGSFGPGGGIKKGFTATTIPLTSILGHAAPLVVQDEGEYSAVIQLYWKGGDGKEYSQLIDGFVRVNVLKKGYRPVGCNDPMIGWKVKAADACEVQFTSAGRSTVCGAGCAQ